MSTRIKNKEDTGGKPALWLLRTAIHWKRKRFHAYNLKLTVQNTSSLGWLEGGVWGGGGKVGGSERKGLLGCAGGLSRAPVLFLLVELLGTYHDGQPVDVPTL
ncbi:uncharacterized protein LAJ45_01160 [Morchella importuna]|uniref:uncharacterized protein n=1 Tax=Morchella importuna TaxID=1174673 RepID=UPI001E8E16D9|nr:uncharacterized protein LAJ45_01160 [Morchella importuna]KAH8154632.1 hypothetical protein LAJ45_01160 [Morchella importuna]